MHSVLVSLGLVLAAGFCHASALPSIPQSRGNPDDTELFKPDRYRPLATPISNSTLSPLPEIPTDDEPGVQAACFPALDYTPPYVGSIWEAPPVPLNQWRCDQSTERGFLGFSYYVEWCQSKEELVREFKRMRNEFRARYVRLYSWCDPRNDYFPADVVSAAYEAGIGVYFTIWFGFDGTNDWQWRRDTLLWLVDNVPLARYVIKSIDVGSEPLYDWVLSPYDLAQQVNYMKSRVNKYGIQVSISEMKYGYEVQGDAQVVLDAVDVIHAHHLPFFDQNAGYGNGAWPSVSSSTNWFRDRTGWSKKIIFTQTGWPTNTDVWPPNSPNAVASVDSSKAYFDLLDSKCAEMKANYPYGGVGWFWQIYKDGMLPGWGALDWNENAKFRFAPRTDC